MQTDTLELQKAEQSLLGLLISHNNLINEAIPELKPEYFSNEVNQVVYHSIITLWNNGNPVDALVLIQYLKQTEMLETVGGEPYIHFIAAQKGLPQHLDYYLETIINGHILARGKSIGFNLIRELEEGTGETKAVISNTVKDLHRLLDCFYNEKTHSISELIANVPLTDNRENSVGKNIPSGFSEFDTYYGGFTKGEYVLLGGRPGMGKSTLLINLAINIAKAGKGVLYFSYEMSSDHLMKRVMSAELEIPLGHYSAKKLNNQELEKLKNATAFFENWPLYFKESTSLGFEELMVTIRRLKSGKNVEVVMVDYLQLIESFKQRIPREQALAGISGKLKQLARELDIVIIASSQLSRQVETRTGNKRPQLSDLRESGALEQDADKVLFLYRPEYYRLDEFEDGDPAQGLAEVMLAKNRNGAMGDFRLRFLPRFGKFIEIAEGEKYFVNQFNTMRAEEFNDNAPF